MLASAVRCWTFSVKQSFVLPDCKDWTQWVHFFESSNALWIQPPHLTFSFTVYLDVLPLKLYNSTSTQFMFFKMLLTIVHSGRSQNSNGHRTLVVLCVSAGELWKYALTRISYGLSWWIVMSVLQACVFQCLNEICDSCGENRLLGPGDWQYRFDSASWALPLIYSSELRIFLWILVIVRWKKQTTQ